MDYPHVSPGESILAENLLCRFDALVPAGRPVAVCIAGWEGATARVEVEV